LHQNYKFMAKKKTSKGRPALDEMEKLAPVTVFVKTKNIGVARPVLIAAAAKYR